MQYGMTTFYAIIERVVPMNYVNNFIADALLFTLTL